MIGKMAKIVIDKDTLASKLASILMSELEKELRQKLMENADVIVTELARDIASKLTSYTKTHYDYRNDLTKYELHIDGVNELVK